MKKKRVLCVVLLVLLSAMSALAGGAGEEAAKGPRTVLKVGVDNFPSRWDPAARFSNNSMKIHGNLHDGLVRYNPYGDDLSPKPMLAVNWKEISPTVMEFRLREGVRFWDGTMVTAEDVAWSINRSIRGDHPRYKKYAYGRVLYNLKEVEVVDELTVRIHTVKPEPMLFSLLSQTPAAILSKKAFDATGGDFAAFMRDPIGCGPYKIKEFRDDEFIKLERFDDYWGEPAPLEELHYYLIADTSARITALVTGEIDLIVAVPPDQIGALENRPGIKILGNNPLLFHVYALNATRYPISDQKIRMAMNLAVNREALNKALWKGKGVVPTSFQHRSTPGYDPEWNVFEYNPEKARQLIHEANYDGTLIEFPVIRAYYLYADQAAQAVARMWEDVGLKVQLQFVEDYGSPSAEHPEEFHMIRAWSNTASLPFEPIGIIPDWYPTDWPVTSGLVPDWAPEGHPVHPKGKYRDKYIDLFERARYGTDKSERFQAFREFIEHFHYDVTPWVVLYTPYEYYAMDDDIEWDIPPNYHPYTMPFRAGEISFR